MKSTIYDVIIIGAGIVGASTARFLSRFKLKTLVLEKSADVATGASKANSGILHAGYDSMPGTLKAKLNVKGFNMYKSLVNELDIPFKKNGSMVISFNENGEESLKPLYNRGLENRVKNLEIITGEKARELEPNLNINVTASLLARDAGIISPYEATIAFAENAFTNGVEFLFESEVIKITKKADKYIVKTKQSEYLTKIVINTAGIHSADVFNLIHEKKEGMNPQKGEYYLLDNTQENLVNHTIFQLPTHLGKGVLIAPTVDGNILIGPTADDIKNGEDTSTTKEGLAGLLKKASLSLNNLPMYDKITSFAGVRAKHSGKDFIIEETNENFINVMGIDSPGITAAPAIADYITTLVLNKLEPMENNEFNKIRKAIKKSTHGKVVCRCETITEEEIIDVINRPLGAKTLDGIKRRTRAQAGRCQGGFCTLKIVEILSKELQIPETAVTKNGHGTSLFM